MKKDKMILLFQNNFSRLKTKVNKILNNKKIYNKILQNKIWKYNKIKFQMNNSNSKSKFIKYNNNNKIILKSKVKNKMIKSKIR